jgi:uncharacterized protein (TIGR02453 family)
MPFRGWKAEAVEFFEGLEADNSRAYWQAHKDVYERLVRGPMEELLAELAPEFGPPKLFRPYRDVRFSPDKTPYKTHIGATLGDTGYVQLSASGLGAGTGLFHMAPDQLDRYRRAVADDGTGSQLEAVVEDLRQAGIDLIAHDQLKTAPRGYPKDHPRVDLLRRKGLAAWQEWPPAAWLGTKKAKDRVVGFLHDAAPLRAWLAEHVGASTMAEQ